MLAYSEIRTCMNFLSDIKYNYSWVVQEGWLCLSGWEEIKCASQNDALGL